ncbi:MAG: LytTR family DNA-binding domain-containing protein [Bacteroidales bacterium]|jgi:hypothetical protein|nr:LytTR family DNA-binding domain-containing protein [Bacteroidales bacterium]MDD2687030.1 LytTR family DNA-binding domain-containing protein [Bacteroidales bacterium]MDD3331346.1 LytTR family DNA-binding domain-containing protein [Bacteroidales bacterium]MDD3692047.1 LytTR family DNA-binding domain-containing protein [Bacteroidales bacterium]MDD4045299.1 LytTR family DNA-binding domain-containing protein [Bacteroidales bacterium]
MAKKLPGFFTEKTNTVKFLLFVTFFALTFIIIYKPFGSNKWLTLIGREAYMLYMSILVLIGFIILTTSRIVMSFVNKHNPFTYLIYISWIIAEIIIIAISCTLVAWSIKEEPTTFFEILPRTFFYTISILIIPYTLSWLYFSMKENEKVIKRFTQEEPKEVAESTKDLINFTDEKGNLRLSVKIEHLYYIESANNYVYIYYENNKKEITKSTLRSSLKIIEESYPESGLIRCHRSYIINFKKVKILRKEKDGLFLELDSDEIADIPVSKTYVDEMIKLFSKHSV